MAYQIRYGQTITKTTLQENPRNRKIRPAWILLISALIAIILWGRAKGIPDFLIPGNKAVTEAALSTMVDDILDGEKLGDAITAFCMEIIEHANIPE